MQRLTKEQMEQIIQLFSAYMDDYLYIMDLKSNYYRISKGAVERFMVPAEAFENARTVHAAFVYEEDREMLDKDLGQILEGKKKSHNLHYRWIGKDGSPIWINCRGGVIDDENGNPAYLIGCINETGEKQRADNVSGLLGEKEFSTYVKACGEQFTKGFLMHIGIDDFSSINSISSVSYSDHVIKKVADCIKECLMPKQHLFHISGDEYVILDQEDHTCKEAILQYKSIRKKVSELIDAEKYKVVFTVSAGIVGDGNLRGGYEEILKFSDFALKQAQDQSKNSYYVFNKDDYEQFLKKKKLSVDLQYAVNNNYEGFEVYYQPIVDAETAKLIGAEALMRFSVPTQEGIDRISPMEFIPLLEETGLILPAGRWILGEAASVCSVMQKHIPGFRMNVNISYVQVMKSDVLKDILGVIRKYDLPPECMGIELTENGYLESDPHFRKLREGLKKNRVPFIIDDFGTGYSNFYCISELNPTYIKIDRAFTNKAMESKYDHELMVKIIEMAHNLNIRICIEGVEEAEVHKEVKKIHADYIQGYLFGKPCSKEEFFASQHIE